MHEKEGKEEGDEAVFRERQGIWRRKPHIRLVYQRWIEKMKPWMAEGAVLEVGSGTGLTKELLPEVHLSDIVVLPWLDTVMDATAMPFKPGDFKTIIGLDVFHHFADPWAFLREAGRVLPSGGRLLLIEPAITGVSWFFYRFFHHEAIYFKGFHRPSGGQGEKEPWQGNLAMMNVVFNTMKKGELEQQTGLTIRHREWFSFFDFQLAGGFRSWALVPYGIFRQLIKLDDWLKPLMKGLGFRMFIVLEKTGSAVSHKD